MRVFLHNKLYYLVKELNITEICLEYKLEKRNKDHNGNLWTKTGWFLRNGEKHLLFETALQYTSEAQLFNNKEAMESVKFINKMAPIAQALGPLFINNTGDFEETSPTNKLIP